jgi:hypothetical protein
MTPDQNDGPDGTLGEAQWQRAASVVERFLKISDNAS